MLVDLLADCLPNRKKKRWHFNTFMLETLAKLEQLRQSRSSNGSTDIDGEYSLIWLAKDMIEKSPILFLDEFQLPDRAANKILSHLFTTFFQLGGVLIATSNRMPEELSKASGLDFAAPPRGGLVRNWLGLGGRSKMDMYPSKNEYAGFVEVLKARCDIWNIDGGRDWRRREEEDMEINSEASKVTETMREDILESFSGLDRITSENTRTSSEQEVDDGVASASRGIAITDDTASQEESKIVQATTPKKYLLATSDSEGMWQSMLRKSLREVADPIPWQSTELLVYGRKVPVSHHLDGVTLWSFSKLCEGMFGPADYITLASTFHTLILDQIPILTLSQKNEARRLITLLDALYETRCKLIIRAEAGPDDLFFPETKVVLTSPSNEASRDENDGGDAVYPETLSEIYQDQTSPFRPNISSYTNVPTNSYDPDEDSDFGPTGAGRRVDFGMTSSFTGEDERFAYKRARSRLWEMCGTRWHARSEPGWWRPLPLESRRWERSSSTGAVAPTPSTSVKGDVKLGGFKELDRPAGLQGLDLERQE